jgi:hypothetical protein
MWLTFRGRLPGGMLSQLSRTVRALKVRGTIAREVRKCLAQCFFFLSVARS